MPVLKNTRHEKLACALAEGKSATEAMQEAGYSDPRNSTRLTKKYEIAARVAELQAGAAERTELTVAGITERLLRIANAAEASKEAPGLSVARAALMDAAKLNGLLIERTENRNTVYTVVDQPMTEDEWSKQFCTEH